MHFARVLLAACAAFSTANAANYTITIGEKEYNNLTGGYEYAFKPHYISVKNGDFYTFNFSEAPEAGVHRLFRALPDDPCKLDKSSANPGSVYPIFQTLTFPVKENFSPGPVWYICVLSNHCKRGMIFGFNLGDSPDSTFEERKLQVWNTTSQSNSSQIVTAASVKVSVQKMSSFAGVVLLVGLLLVG